ncbi:28515_t:CDS:2, partial [Gigaspora margarita]
MEEFLAFFKPIRDITIFTALYKRVKSGEWTYDRKKEEKNFVDTLNRVLDVIIDDNERLEKLRSFGTGDVLIQRVEEAFEYVRASLELKALNVEEQWIVNASKNFKTLKNEVHKKMMWEEVEDQLNKIIVEDLSYDHPLCSGILDISSAPFTKISPNARKCFNAVSDKVSIPENKTLKIICENFVRKEKEFFLENDPIFSGNARFGEFLDDPEKLQIITNQMLASLSWIWRSSKWKSARRPDYMVVAEIKNKSIEIGYLETGRPNSSLNKQLRDHNKLNRLAKDSIDETWLAKNDRFFRGTAIKKMLTIFTINVVGSALEIQSVHREGSIYRSCLLNRVKLPLYLPSIKPKDIYGLIHALLSFRTAIACTLRNLLYNTDDSSEMMPMDMSISDMSVSPQTSTPIADSPSQPSTPTIEHESRFIKLEQNDKDTASENAELKARVAKLEQKQSQTDEKNNFIVKSDDDAKGIDQSSVNTISTKMKNSNDTNISDNISNSDNASNFEICQESENQYLTSPILIEPKSSEDMETEDSTYKEKDTKSSLSVKGGQGLIQELFTPEPSLQESNIIQNHTIEISKTGGPGKSNIDEASQHLAQLCDKAFDTEDGANRANQEEILCWSIYGKDFRAQFNEIIKNSGGKIGEKKARSLLYDFITKQLSIIHRGPRKISSEIETGNITTLSIPLSHTSSSVTTSSNSIDDISKKVVSLPETEVSISTESHVSNSLPPYENKTRLPISILPEDPKEKQKHVIKMVLKRFTNLSFKHSSKYTDHFNCTETCPVCNEEHKDDNVS